MSTQLNKLKFRKEEVIHFVIFQKTTNTLSGQVVYKAKAIRTLNSEIQDGSFGLARFDTIEFKALIKELKKENINYTYVKILPKILKRHDGSVISKLKDDEEVILIDSYYNLEKMFYGKYLFQDLRKGLIFLPGDIDLAEKKAKMLKKQLEIQYEIDMLKAEEGWVADWSNQEQNKYYLSFCNKTKYVWINNYGDNTQYQNQYMSAKTAETILSKYSQDELKQYLGIII